MEAELGIFLAALTAKLAPISPLIYIVCAFTFIQKDSTTIKKEK